MIRVGLIGCGRIASLHAPGYAGHPEARLAALCDSDADRAKACARDWGAEKAYADYRALLDDPDIDAVEIVTPQTIHEPMVVDALDAGKHVAVQKPMTTSMDSARRMLDAAAKSDRVFKVTDNYLFYPPIVKARELLDARAIGEPMTLRMKFIGGRWAGGWTVPQETWGWRVAEVQAGRGIQTFDHGHHMWAAAWHLMGGFERVSAWIDAMDDVPDCPAVIDCPAVMMWKHRGPKRYGSCEYNQAPELAVPSKYYSCDEWFEVTGRAGILQVRRCTGNITGGAPVRLFTSDGWRDIETPDDWAEGFKGAARNFIDTILGRATPLLTGEQALHILAFAFALRRASDERREVALSEVERTFPA